MKMLYRLIFFYWAFAITTFTSGMGGALSNPIKCSDVFGKVASRVQEQTQYHKDFGSGVFVQKTGNAEFRIEPPPVVVQSARAAQKKLHELAENDDGERFTVVFHGLSEGEVLGFKAMLQRDARLQGDARLTTVLLATESLEAGEAKSYEGIRRNAIAARDRMLRRYDWAKASLNREDGGTKGSQEVYRLTVEKSTEVDTFLLTLRLRAVKMVKNRISQITSLLSSEQLVNATPEQMAHMVVSELKKTDKGITAGTLRVMAGDFIIAQAMPGMVQ